METREPERSRVPALSVFAAFLRLGLSSFGGPAAHLGYFRRELVQRRRWLSEADYSELVALCQFLPGPGSSQTGFAIGLRKAGLAGGLAAFVGFTLPSALLMLAAAFGLAHASGAWIAPVVHGLKLVAVSVVAHAVVMMARANLASLSSAAIALMALGLTLNGDALATPVVIAVAALVGLLVPPSSHDPAAPAVSIASTAPLPVGRSALLFAVFLALFVGLPVASRLSNSPDIAMAGGFYRSGALVFGGGHVVLPLLERATAGQISHADFLSGYGLAQALPGPLFAFGGYAGALAGANPPNLASGLIALAAIFLPGFLLVAAADPLWSRLRANPRAVGVVRCASAAVVGVLAATLWTPVATSAIATPFDALVATAGFLALLRPRTPILAVVAGVAAAGAYFGAIT